MNIVKIKIIFLREGLILIKYGMVLLLHNNLAELPTGYI